MKRTIALAALLLAAFTARAQKIETYPVPRGIYYAQHNDDYTVRIRIPGGEWQDLYEYKVLVDMDRVSEASMVQFDCEGRIDVSIRKNNGTFRKVAVRPLSLGIRPRVEGDMVFFTIEGPCKVSVEFDGDRRHNLHLFANALQSDIPDRTAEGVMWFGEGIHEPEGGAKDGEWLIPSNTTVYLAPGAVLKGKISCRNVENVRITGRGFVFQPQRGIEIAYSKNVTVDGLTFVNPTHYTVFGGQSEGIVVRNIKSFSCRGWSDGIDMMCCSDVLVEDVFMRNSDDCVAIYGHRWDYYGDVRNVEVRNSTLWADIAHPTNIGIHGYTAEGDEGGNVLENITFRNIDILEHDEDDLDYQGCMAICAGDCNLIRNVLYEDIRIERIEEGQLFHFEVVYNEKYNTAPGRGIENVTVRNVTATAHGIRRPTIRGYDSRRGVRGIRFENVRVNGRRMRSLKDFDAAVGDHAEDITVK